MARPFPATGSLSPVPVRYKSIEAMTGRLGEAVAGCSATVKTIDNSWTLVSRRGPNHARDRGKVRRTTVHRSRGMGAPIRRSCEECRRRRWGAAASPCTFVFVRCLFAPFRQASEGKNRTAAGLGTGLTLVDQLVEMLDGEIDADSEPEMGTVGRVRLPREVAWE